MPLPDEASSLRLLREIGSPPTAPFHEDAARDAVEAALDRVGGARRRDRWGNVIAEAASGAPRHAVALVAHLDHPAFEVVEARGRTGRARMLGLFRRAFPEPLALVVQREGRTIPARASDHRNEVDLEGYLTASLRIDADDDLRVGDWATLDLPAFEREGDDVRLRAADDLAGCALMVAVLDALRVEARPHHCYALFTRAEEPGLYGARLAAEDRLLPDGTIVVSIETSRELSGAQARRGPVIRVGDFHHTFDDRAESYLRVAAERLALLRPPISTQRMLMYGGTCEGSAFLDAGYATTAIALPLRNYHNDGPAGPASEIISLMDFRAAVALLGEAVIAAAEDAAEAYRVRTGPVPPEIQRRHG